MLFDLFISASAKFGLTVEDPEWIEVPSKSTATYYQKYISSDVDPKHH